MIVFISPSSILIYIERLDLWRRKRVVLLADYSTGFQHFTNHDSFDLILIDKFNLRKDYSAEEQSCGASKVRPVSDLHLPWRRREN